MSDTSARLALPLLQPGQAQKELSHNEALTLLEMLVQPCVEAVGLGTPPVSPEFGQCWVVGGAPDGAWTGQADAIAMWTASGWRFAAARDGMEVRIADNGGFVRFSNGWAPGELIGDCLVLGGEQVVGLRQSAIVTPAGGATVDAEGRTAVTSILAALRSHGLIAS